jgi:hypothetical protein
MRIGLQMWRDVIARLYVLKWRRMAAKKCDAEVLIASMRRAGLSKVYSIHMLAYIIDIPHNEAKKLAHFSNAWKDVKKRDEDFHDLLDDIFSTPSKELRKKPTATPKNKSG